MKSVIFKPTGRFNAAPDELKPHQRLAANGELWEASEVRSGSFDPVVMRNNAVGDIDTNATGVKIALDTLTYLKQLMIEQKFYEVSVADFIPLIVGEGSFNDALLHTLSFSNADDFESGNINQATGNSQISQANASVSSLTRKVVSWAKGINYTLFEIQQALQSNNWDAIMAKHNARKKNWDLGIQQIAFLGSKIDTSVTGLLNCPSSTVNASFITKALKSMNAAELQAFVGGLIALYRANTSQTAMPNRFVIPQSDYYGLGAMTQGTVGTYPISLLKYLEDAFKAFVPDFKILPAAYGDKEYNPFGKQVYALYRYDPSSVVMDIPVDITTTQPNSLNNFQFQDAAYGQYTGVAALRPAELMRFEY